MRSVTHLALAVGAIAQVLQPPFSFHPRDFIEQPLPTLTKRRENEPCAEVRSSWAAQKAQLSKPDAVPQHIRVPAQHAYNCLMSVPVDIKGDVLEIEELKAFLQWQSTLAWLKTGVEGQIEPHDIMKKLDSLALEVKGGTKYKSDWEVQLSIRRILDAAGDYHLRYDPDITNVFLFARPGGQLVSMSEDGVSLPKLYLVSNLPRNVNGNISGSAVVKINGEDTTKALEIISNGTNYYDADARYNNIFPNPVRNAIYGVDSGALSFVHYIYSGPTTNFTFANKTEKVINNVAIIPSNFDFSGVTDGKSFFKAFCNGPLQPAVQPPASNTSPSPTPSLVVKPTPTPSPSLIGYPKPVFIHGSKMVSGYYVSDNDYKDVAVLAMPSFDITPVDPLYEEDPSLGGLIESQTLIRNFLADTVKQKKKKLVIDLRSNGGGSIDLAFDLFKQLFPTIEPYGGARYRAHEAFHFYSALVADVALEGNDRDGKIGTEWDDADYGIQSTFLWSNILDENLKPFKSYRDYYGPETIHNDTFSSLRRYNFSDNLGGHYIQASITGYNELKNALVQPFQADDIVLLQDGLCGSACTIFAELMREQGKVQSIVMGGRPRNEPMQAIGGTKGVQLLPFDALAQFAQRTILIAEALDGAQIAKQLNDTTNVGKIYNAQQIYQRTSFQEGRKLAGGVTSLNSQRQGDTSQTPLQFIYEAADCRLFYTTATYLDPLKLWKMAADAKWGKGKCVPGSTGHKTAIGAQEGKPGFTSKGVAQQSNADGDTPFQTASAASSLGVSGILLALAGVMVGILAL